MANGEPRLQETERHVAYLGTFDTPEAAGALFQASLAFINVGALKGPGCLMRAIQLKHKEHRPDGGRPRTTGNGPAFPFPFPFPFPFT